MRIVCANCVIASCARAAVGMGGAGSLTECGTFQQHARVKAKVAFFPHFCGEGEVIYYQQIEGERLTVNYIPQVLRNAFE